MYIRINFFLLFLIFYIILSVFLSKRNIFEYLEKSKHLNSKQMELNKIKEKNEEIEKNINLLYDRDADFIEELLKNKFNLKLKNEYVIFFKKNK